MRKNLEDKRLHKGLIITLKKKERKTPVLTILGEI